MAYALALGKPTLLIHPNTWKKKWLNVVKREASSIFKNFIHPHTLERFTFCEVADIITMNQYEAKNL